jgi:site-specific recombinase XerD
MTLPALISDDTIAANHRRYAEAAKGAYTDNTVRAHQSDVLIFTRWCDDVRQESLPATPETVAAFVDFQAQTKAPATVGRYVSSIAIYHRAADVPNPCTALVVTLALKRMRRALGVAQKQAAPLNDELVRTLLRTPSLRLLNLRNRALLTVAYVTMCRRGELVALLYGDLAVEGDGFGTIVIRRGKTDQEGHGAIAPIPADAMRHVQAWLQASGITDGLLFRAVLKGNRLGGPLGAGDVARAFKLMAQRAGLSEKEIAGISGHSTRVGSAQDMLRYGEQLPSIMQAGRWRTAEMVGRYTAKQGARQSAAVRIAERRVQF